MEKKEFSKNFSKRFLKALDGKTQSSVAKKLGFSQAFISKYLAGDVPESFIFLNKLAQEYQIDIHELITGEESLKHKEEITKYKTAIRRVLAYYYGFVGRLSEEKYRLENEKAILINSNISKEPVMLGRVHEIEKKISDLDIEHLRIHKKLETILNPLGVNLIDDEI